jgi:hypothetical protein
VLLTATPTAFADVGEHPTSFPGHHRQQGQLDLKSSKRSIFVFCDEIGQSPSERSLVHILIELNGGAVVSSQSRQGRR